MTAVEIDARLCALAETNAARNGLAARFTTVNADVTAPAQELLAKGLVRDGYDPPPGDGLGWHPQSVWIATYDAGSLARLSFGPAPNAGVAPIYGYAVDSDDDYTYLFGNTFEQNLVASFRAGRGRPPQCFDRPAGPGLRRAAIGGCRL